MKKIISAALAAIMLLATQVQSTQAFSFNNAFFSTAAIDSDSDGLFDLLICFTDNDDVLNVNRQEYLEFFRQEWGKSMRGDFSVPGHSYQDGFASADYCQSGDTSNIWIVWKNHWSNCDESPGNPYMQARPYQNVFKMEIWVNFKCISKFDFSGTVDNGKASVKSGLLHEIGHLLGLSHTNIESALMYGSGPTHCNILSGFTAGIALDDSNGFQSRYPGIFKKYDVIPARTPCWT